MNTALHLWIVTDGKPGHFNQSLGLVEALHRRVPELTWQKVDKMSVWRAVLLALKCKKNKLAPQIVIGAGHHTHLTLLILAKVMRARSVVLMKPSIPFNWFDLCIIPTHDSPPIRPNIVTSIGPLNRMQPAQKEVGSGLILIGGPSKNFGWDSVKLHTQVVNIIQQEARNWTLVTSRRTPSDTITSLQSILNVKLMLASDTDFNWLPSILAKTELCWVTKDSMSMIYEALTAGCIVKLLDIPYQSENRITLSLKKLQLSGYLNPSTINVVNLAEADRCATIIQQRFLA